MLSEVEGAAVEAAGGCCEGREQRPCTAARPGLGKAQLLAHVLTAQQERSGGDTQGV